MKTKPNNIQSLQVLPFSCMEDHLNEMDVDYNFNHKFWITIQNEIELRFFENSKDSPDYILVRADRLLVHLLDICSKFKLIDDVRYCKEIILEYYRSMGYHTCIDFYIDVSA